MLSCSCDFDNDDSWYYYSPDNFSVFSRRKRARCCSCDTLIDIGAQCIEFPRYRCPRTEVEERIYGSEIKLAHWFMCEKCGEIFLNLDSLGYCLRLGESMQENLEDYWYLTGFKREVKDED